MSSRRLNFVVEGQTEEAFVKQLLVPHLAQKSIWAYVRCVQTSRKRNIKHRGGLARYQQARGDIRRWMGEETGTDVRFTTMFDLFRLPTDFPGYNAPTPADPRDRAIALQDAMLNDIGDDRLLPYIQVHEFEALVLSDPNELATDYPESVEGVRRLVTMVAGFASPELIDGGSETAPSKRIAKHVPGYSKTTSGPLVAARIGLPTLRAKCPHFGAWVDRLESVDPRPLTRLPDPDAVPKP